MVVAGSWVAKRPIEANRSRIRLKAEPMSTIGDLDGQGRASTARDGFGGLVKLAKLRMKKRPQNVNNDVKTFPSSCAMTRSRHCVGEIAGNLRQSICRHHMGGNDANPFATRSTSNVARVAAKKGHTPYGHKPRQSVARAGRPDLPPRSRRGPWLAEISPRALVGQGIAVRLRLGEGGFVWGSLLTAVLGSGPPDL